MKQNGSSFESDTVSLRVFSEKEEDEQLEMFEGKLKRFKNWPSLPKTRDFRNWDKSHASRQDQPPEH